MFDVSAVELIGLSRAPVTETQFVSVTGSWDVCYEGWGRCAAAYCDDVNATLTLHDVQGAVSFEILKFCWAGVIEISNDTETGSFDLFAPVHASYSLTVSGRGPRNVRLRLLSETNAASHGRQLWIRRVTFEERPHWIARERRLTPAVDFVSALEGDFLTLANDTAISRDIRLYGIWGKTQVEIFRRFLRPGDIAVDVGANLGHHTVSMAKIVGSNGKVYAFEPQKRVYRLLCANLAINRCDQAEAFELALGEMPGGLAMQPLSYDDIGHPWNVGSLGCSTYESAGPTASMVAVGRLDDVLPTDVPVSFIKCDAQGFDGYVLRGAADLIERFHPTILTEVAPELCAACGSNYLAIYDLLYDLGYKFRDPETLGICGTPRVWSGRRGEEWDLLAIHPGNTRQCDRLPGGAY